MLRLPCTESKLHGALSMAMLLLLDGASNLKMHDPSNESHNLSDVFIGRKNRLTLSRRLLQCIPREEGRVGAKVRPIDCRSQARIFAAVLSTTGTDLDF
jgi:hypothetical protein